MERKRTKKGEVSNMENGIIKGKQKQSNLKGDYFNIALLFFLYTLQGIPLGLSSAIPMLLLNRGVTYKQQVFVLYY